MASRSRCDTAANENAKSSRDSRERSRTPIMRRDWGQVSQYHLATLRDSGGCSGLEFADLSEKLKSIHASKERLVCTNKKLRGENEELRLSMRDLEQMNVRLVEEKEKLEIDNRRLSMNGILEEGEIASSDSDSKIEQLERKIQSLVETCRRQSLSILRHIREKGKLDAHSSVSQ